MLSLDYSKLLILAVVIAIVLFWPPKNKSFHRRGIDPGFLNLKVWPARIWFLLRGRNIVEQAYLQEKDAPYLLQSLNEDSLVLPPKYLPELRMLPGGKLSASEALVTSVLGQHSGVDVVLKDRQHYDIARVQLMRSLPTLVPILSAKVDSILSETLAACSTADFTHVKIKEIVSALVLRTTLLTFVGPELCENTELQWLVEEFTNIVRDMAIFLLFIPKFLRPVLWPVLPPTARMKRLHERVRRILFPKTEKNVKSSRDFPTVIDHFVATSEIVDEKEIVAKFLVLMAGALHTTKMSTSHAIIDLCASPECVDELRNEALAENLNDLPWHLDQVSCLKKLDSFLKESQRFNPPNYLSFDRIATSTFTLQDGTAIPKGTFISMAAGPMAMDPGYYEDAQTFSATRFCKTDESAVESGAEKSQWAHEFVSTESGNIHWGHGRFTCPGRWYASAVMKVVIAQILRKYEVKFPEGQRERLPNVYLDLIVEPNPKQVVRFRARE
ncbi:cytochrome P450 [Lentithecium fluviatile CBS 122367]|uniref:Cytochrome P450 n=1 Tax=Lentithecium fluviatile CBS 122367 TaxID=1168545 RepID=A0A6G1J1T4_9PLEO|nr:cytochrome P450 [Lentithecium fluviatile CBS 122367]